MMSNQKTERPLVSVVMITYGHEHYIAQAIEGVLSQGTNFQVELIIADDCSPDETQSIVQQIITNHPEGYQIKYHRHTPNKGMMSNFIWALEQAKGKYIALCEGDDYWVDSSKLQKQVDFLDNNNEAILVFNNAIKLFSDETTSQFNTYNKTLFKSNDLWGQWLIPTASVLYRNIPLNFPDWFWKSTHGDLALFLLLGEHGHFGCINEVMCVYRIHETGVTNSDFKSIDHKLKHIEQLKAMDDHFELKFHDQIAKRLIGYYLSASYLLAKNGVKKQVFSLTLESLRLKFFTTLKNQYFYKTLLYLLFSWKSKNH